MTQFGRFGELNTPKLYLASIQFVDTLFYNCLYIYCKFRFDVLFYYFKLKSNIDYIDEHRN